jgi:N-methylhydantoinase B
VFLALVKAIPDKVAAAPAGSSGNFALGGWDPAKGAGYVMYQISGGGYGGNADHDGLTNGCSTIGISKSQPVEVLEQYYPDPVQALRAARGLGRRRCAAWRLRRALRGGAAARGGARLLRHGPRPLRPARRARRRRRRAQRGARAPRRRDLHPEHLSKDQDIALAVGDRVEVLTPGGGGYGNAFARDPALVARDVARGYYTAEQARALYGVAWR